MAHGGKRQNAGRKASSKGRKIAVQESKAAIERVLGKTAREAITAAVILSAVDEMGEWISLIADPKTKLPALMYLSDKRDGKAKQFIENKDVSYTPEERRQRIAYLLGKLNIP